MKSFIEDLEEKGFVDFSAAYPMLSPEEQRAEADVAEAKWHVSEIVSRFKALIEKGDPEEMQAIVVEFDGFAPVCKFFVWCGLLRFGHTDINLARKVHTLLVNSILKLCTGEEQK